MTSCDDHFPELRILDLGCGEGVYAIEAGLRGAEVLALDARTQRMDQGAACAARHGLTNVRFVRRDVRDATREAFGSFDVVYLLGLLYHLDAPDVFRVLENVYDLCTGMLVIDTLISLIAEIQVEWQGQAYRRATVARARRRRHRRGPQKPDPQVHRQHVQLSLHQGIFGTCTSQCGIHFSL